MRPKSLGTILLPGGYLACLQAAGLSVLLALLALADLIFVPFVTEQLEPPATLLFHLQFAIMLLGFHFAWSLLLCLLGYPVYSWMARGGCFKDALLAEPSDQAR